MRLLRSVFFLTRCATVCLTLSLGVSATKRRTHGLQPEIRIGERLGFYRHAKGKTQAVVAGLAGVTEDYLSQIERGLKTPTLPLVHRFSKILGVRVSELLGESATEHDEAVDPVGYAVQRALMAYAGADEFPDLAALRERVNAAWGIWQGSPRRFSEISEVLPDLVSDVQAVQRGLAGSSSADDRREGQRISADLYFLLRLFTKRIGRTDLSLFGRRAWNSGGGGCR
jgi:transcriptional regulator with XRE-family HTH domain